MGGDFATRAEAQGYVDTHDKAGDAHSARFAAKADASAVSAHTGNRSNPHAVTAAQVGADPVGSAAAVQTSLTAHTGSQSNPHSVTAAQVGLGNVDNTSDLNKPISTATQTALNGKAPAYTYGTTDLEAGVSTLETGKLHFIYE